eukprot:TRINITY_DN562_c0_g1_i1.p1 TRINITY_DN562_c0_g1~~TRINITY_DN562_c0_g1_i1.p1  ORF type:complete len:517 (-),score=138.90 TRINITY_DN562_c0_g1_i1:83-1633(-)
MLSSRTLFACFTLAFLLGVNAQFYGYSALLEPESLMYQRNGLWAKSDTPFGGSGEAFIAPNFQFVPFNPLINDIDTSLTPGPLEIVAIHYSITDQIGLLYGEDYYYCCNPDLFAINECNTLNQLIIRTSKVPEENGFLLYHYTLTNNYNFTEITSVVNSGIWYLMIANCNPYSENGNGTYAYMEGEAEWRSSYGYLPAQIYPFLGIYWAFVIVYGIIGAIIGGMMLRYRRDLMKIQYFIFSLIALSIIENIIWGADYTVFNQRGLISNAFNVFGVLFSGLKLLAFRIVLFLVCYGWTITKPALLPRARIALIIISTFYIIVVWIDKYIDVVSTAGYPTSEGFSYFIYALVVFINVIFFVWIFFNLYASLKQLKIAGEHAKLGMLRQLAVAIIVVAIALAVVFILEIALVFAALDDQLWKFWWFWDTYWEIIYFIIITVIAFIWRPTANNNRFAFQPFMDESKSGVELEGSGREEVPSEVEQARRNQEDPASSHSSEKYSDKSESISEEEESFSESQ